MYANNKFYNILTRWHFTYYVLKLTAFPSGLKGYIETYFYSYDRMSCYKDYGENGDPAILIHKNPLNPRPSTLSISLLHLYLPLLQ
jgi:hypothetical protein